MVSQWLFAAIEDSLNHHTYWSETNTGSHAGPARRPFQKLLDGIRYSKIFILNYPLLILGIILFFTAAHWTGNALRWRERRITRLQTLRMMDAYAGEVEPIEPIIQGNITKLVILDGDDGATPSESSTIQGTSSPLLKGTDEPENKDINEDAPLLHPTHMGRRTIISSIRAFLIYQPRPIPYLNKTLPSNGASIVILAFIALNIFFTFYRIHFTVFELVVLADRASLVFVVNLPLLYLLAAKNQPLNFLTGRSYETLNIFHRRLGEILCLEAAIHCFGMLGVWYTLLRPSGLTFARFLITKIIYLGIAAFISYELLYLTSLASFRKRWYEVFLAFHITLQTFALVFLFFHHHNTRLYVGVSLAIFLVDRIVYRLSLKSKVVVANSILMDDGETVKLSTDIIKRPRNVWCDIFGRSIADGWQATDHVFVTVPSLSWYHSLQAHPFTIASPAPSFDEDETRLDLLIRAQDGFSLDLLNRVYHLQRLPRPTLTIRLDGPYGSSQARNLLASSDLAIVVAGGSGIAVCWPLVHYLLRITRSTDTEIVPTRVLRRQKVVLIWIIHKKQHKKWIGKQALKEVENMGVQVIIPKSTERVGRPDLQGLIVDSIDAHGIEIEKKIGVVASGPDSMGRLVRNTCSKLVGMGRNIDVTVEKFGW